MAVRAPPWMNSGEGPWRWSPMGRTPPCWTEGPASAVRGLTCCWRSWSRTAWPTCADSRRSHGSAAPSCDIRSHPGTSGRHGPRNWPSLGRSSGPRAKLSRESCCPIWKRPIATWRPTRKSFPCNTNRPTPSRPRGRSGTGCGSASASAASIWPDRKRTTGNFASPAKASPNSGPKGSAGRGVWPCGWPSWA